MKQKTPFKKKEIPLTNMKDRIIKESIQLFLRKSFKGTSIQQITDALGITKGAFYWHFKSKDELLETIIDKYDEEFLKKLYSYIRELSGDFYKKYREYHKYINEYAIKNSEFCVLFVTLSAEIAGSNTAAEIKIKNVIKKYLEFIESLLKIGKEEGVFESDYDISLNAHIIEAVHSGVLLQWYIYRKEIHGPALGRTYRDILLYGMVKRNKKRA
jgi:AcrR family transcriptional regulator